MKAIAIEIKNEAAKTRNEREGFQFLEMERNKETKGETQVVSTMFLVC